MESTRALNEHRRSSLTHGRFAQRLANDRVKGVSKSTTQTNACTMMRSLSSFTRLSRRYLTTDSICELASSNLRFGPGSTAEVGADLRDSFEAKSVVVVTDPIVRNLKPVATVLESLEHHNVEYTVFDKVRVEPNDVSFRSTIDWFRQQSYDAVVAVGGGSVMDTAKAANLYACNPSADFYDFVNPPTGQGLPVPRAIKPLIAIPTTAGTGSETTGVAIFDDSPTSSKTGIASRQLKPTLGIVDPDNTATLPPLVATYSGLDVLCHAIESYTALPYNKRAKPSSPLLRPAYQGSNPIADVWSLFALQTCAANLLEAVQTASDHARAQMLLASSSAGLGFGNAGVHLCHGMSYPIASQVREYRGYTTADHPLVPHGLSVIVNAPAVFEFTGVADPERHATCARILAKARGAPDRHVSDAGAWLADEIRIVCDDLGVQLGLRQFGYSENDIGSLVNGTIQQHRVTKISPRPVDRPELEQLFQAAMDG